MKRFIAILAVFAAILIPSTNAFASVVTWPTTSPHTGASIPATFGIAPALSCVRVTGRTHGHGKPHIVCRTGFPTWPGSTCVSVSGLSCPFVRLP